MQLGQRLGEGIDPRMFVQDYSGFTRAAEIQAQGMQNLGATIGQGIKDFGEARQERKKIDAEIKATSAGIESAIKMGKDLGIDIGSYLSPIQAKINDPNTSPVEALALGRTAAQGISNAFTLGIGAQERSIASQRARDENAFRLANLEVAQQRANIYGQKAQAEASELTRDTIKAFDPDTGQDKEWDVWKNKQGDLLTPDKKSRIVDPDKYIYGEPGGVQELPTTSQIAPSKQINQSALSSPLRKYAQSFEEYGNKYRVDPALLAAIAEHETGGGKSSAFRNKNNAMGVSNASGPIKMASVEASIEKMASLLGRGMNEGKGPYANAKSIEDIGRKYAPIGAGNDPGNLNKFWTRGVSSKYEKLATPKQIDEAISMGDDGSQQAMGTPEQQAEVGRIIEQSAGMRTAQAAPSGAMPTEPRINQQPQPAPRRMVGGRPVGGGAAQGTIMNAEQVKNLTDRGFKVDAIPTNDGNFTVSGVTAGGQTPRYTKTPQEELETRRLTNLDQLQSDVRATGVSAAQDIAPFKEIVGLLDASVKTGFGRQTLMTAKKILGADVSNEEQFQTRVGELAMRNIALTKGAISDREMDYFKTVLSPNMGKTTEGNKKIIEFKLKYAERADTIAKIISKMQSQNADPYVIQSEIDKIIESTPLVTVGSTPTSPSSQAESDASFIQGFQSGE
jgi:hypothetical protein